MCWQREQDAPCEAGSAGGARRFVSAWLREVFPEEEAADLVDDVELVTSELTANAVNAGCAILGLRLTVHDRWLEVELSDDAAGVPEIRGPSANGIDGRGLLIVQALSLAWGSQPREDGGKTVWSRLAVPPGLLAQHSGCRVPTPPAAPAPRSGS